MMMDISRDDADGFVDDVLDDMEHLFDRKESSSVMIGLMTMS